MTEPPTKKVKTDSEKKEQVPISNRPKVFLLELSLHVFVGFFSKSRSHICSCRFQKESRIYFQESQIKDKAFPRMCLALNSTKRESGSFPRLKNFLITVMVYFTGCPEIRGFKVKKEMFDILFY